MKKKKNKEILDIIKAARKLSREEEIKLHGKPINQTKIVQSKKVYNRNKLKNNIIQDSQHQ
ncbi:hypothetical protein SDC9_30208 [bioreactor metagenome]|jgi:hypothetical protein|uniref:Uncharacterized protein n=1 Tax=bioreactor metagenome TaxID=1076179 RepID=A0A644UZ68_9ZZZZ|nr:hypothetical protein [Paludibacter sp.]